MDWIAALRRTRVEGFGALVVALSLAAASANGCGPREARKQSAAKVSAALVGTQQREVDRVEVTVTLGSAVPWATLVMSRTDATHWSLHIEGLPAGSSCTLTADAKAADGTPLYEGSAEVILEPGSTAQVAILAQEVLPSPGPATYTPVLDTLSASAVLVEPGAEVNLGASAHQPRGGAVSYHWNSACGGRFGAADAAATAWTAPASAGASTCQLSLTISSEGGTVTAFLVVQLQATGEAQVNVRVNAAPIVIVAGHEYIVEPGQTHAQGIPDDVPVGMTADIEITASDPDGDALTYDISSSCADATLTPLGQAGPASAGTPRAVRFHVDVPAARCSVTVVVTDDLGGSTTATSYL